MDGFNELHSGQWVKVKITLQDGKHVAHAVKVKPVGETPVMEGVLRDIDLQNSSVSLMNRVISISEDLQFKSTSRGQITLADVEVGNVVKLIGEYDPANGLRPEKAKVRDSEDSEFEELQGYIESTNPESRSFNILGYTVFVEAMTKVKGV